MTNLFFDRRAIALVAFSIFTAVGTASPATPPSEQTAAAKLADGLMIYSSFDSGSVIPDMDFGSDRQFSKGPFAFESGPVGKALQIGGGKSTGFLYWAYTNAHPRRGTVAFWIKPAFLDNLTDRQDVFHLAHMALFAEKKHLHWTSYIQHKKKRTSRFNDTYPVLALETLKPDAWYHLALSWDSRPEGLVIDVYLNGKNVWTKNFPDEEVRAIKPNTAIGCGLKSHNVKSPVPEPGQWTSMSVDEFGLWERVLSASEVRQLAEKTRPDLRERKQAALFEVRRAQVDEYDYIYFTSRPVRYDVELQSLAEHPIDVELYFEDFYGRKVAMLAPCRLEGKKSASLAGTFAPPGTGVYKLVANAATPSARQMHDLFAVSVVPALDYQKGDGQDSFFGNHPDTGDYTGRAPTLAEARKIGVRWARGLNFMQSTWWAMIEPQKGKFQWERTDEAVRQLKKNHLHVMGVLFATPRWATSAPASEPDRWGYWCYPPDNYDDYRNYVRAVVGRYKDYIRHWEVWNEPWATCWRGTPEEYVKLCRVSYETIKQIDPDIKVVGGGGAIVFQLPWCAKVFQAGLNKYQDIFSIHGYSDEFTPLSRDLMGKHGTFLVAIRDLMRKHGGGERPIWNTETGAFSGSFLRQVAPTLSVWREKDYRKGAYDLVRYEVLQLADGVKKHFHYYMARVDRAWHKGSPVSDNMMEYVDLNLPPNSSDAAYVAALQAQIGTRRGGGGVKPMGVAYAVLAKMVDGCTFVTQGKTPSHIRWFLFQDAGRAVVVYWRADGGQDVAWRVPAAADKATLYNVMGNPLKTEKGKPITVPAGEEPRYLNVSGGSTQSVVSALKASN